jgi:hypothetical protein
MHILKGNGIDLYERRLYMEQSVKVKLDQEEWRSVKIGRWAKEGYYLSPDPARAMDVCLLWVLRVVK